jgi:hypothetical protein
VVIAAWVTLWKTAHTDKAFNCWARLHTLVEIKDCQRKSFSDVFFSLHPGGEGYILIEGTWSCQGSTYSDINGLINLTYTKSGAYYSIHVKDRNPQLEAIFNALKYQDIKIKITELNSSDYILRFPNETLMMCTEY